MNMDHPIELIAMSDAERDVFIADALVVYREEMVRTGRWTPDHAQQRVEAILKDSPPDRHAAGQRYFRVLGAGETVGGLWLQYDIDVLFVMQITIVAHKRGQGWGRAAMAAVERMAREQGIRRLGLNVFFNNLAAKHLYESEGYVGILQQMIKRLD